MVRLIMFSSLWIFPLMENTPKLFVKPGMEWGPWKSLSWTLLYLAGRTETKQVINKVPNTSKLQNRWLSCSCGINTVNQPPTTLVYSTCAYYPCVRIWKQLLLDMSAQSFYVCCFFLFDKVDLIIIFMMKTFVRLLSPVIFFYFGICIYMFLTNPLWVSANY